MKKKPVLHKRLFEYLFTIHEKNGFQPVPRQVLFDLSINKGYSKQNVWDALEILRGNYRIVDYHEEKVGVVYVYAPFTDEEVEKMIDDAEWFDNL